MQAYVTAFKLIYLVYWHLGHKDPWSKIQCRLQTTSDNANYKIKTFITNLVYGPDFLVGISHHMRVFILVCSIMSSSSNFFLYLVHSSGGFGANFTVGVVQSWLAPSPWAMMKWPCMTSSRGAGTQPAQPAQVSCLLTCDNLLPVNSCL